MEFIITGATGFLGKEVTRKALAAGHKVFAITRSPKKAVLELGVHKNLEVVELTEFLKDSSKISCKRAIHLAWADVQNYNDNKNASENAELQRNFIKALMKTGVTDITSAGTCLEYGMVEGICCEDMEISEEIPTQYAKGKRKSYLELQELQKTKPELIIKWVRCFYTYGYGQRQNSLFSLVINAIKNKDTEFNMSKGDQERDYTNLDTLAHNILAIAQQTEVSGIINLGSGKPTTVLEFIESILKLKNHEMKLNRGFYPYSNYEPHKFWADITKLKKVSGVKFDGKIWL